MAILPVGIGSAEEGGYQIERSLRFNSADSAYLNRTFTTPTNNKIWTFSAWIKNCGQSDFNPIFGGDSNSYGLLYFHQTNNALQFYDPGTGAQLYTTALYRDPSAWYHIMFVYDSTQATSTNRMKWYVNGVQVTDFAFTSYPSLNATVGINTAIVHYIGRHISAGKYANQYMTEINFIDGSALDPTSFGEFNEDTGVWQPIEYTGSYGTNGFYLNFSDNSGTTSTTLGKDQAGSNNWTPNNFSVTAGAGNDSLVDTPTNYGTDTGLGGEVRGNYCTLNPLTLYGGDSVCQNGNLFLTAPTSGDSSVNGTIAMRAGEKYYFEAIYNEAGGSGGQATLGITSKLFTGAFSKPGSSAGEFAFDFRGSAGTPQAKDEGSLTTYGTQPNNGDVVGIAVDLSTGKFYAHKANSYYNSGDPVAGTGAVITGIPTNVDYLPHIGLDGGPNNNDWVLNFGQRPFSYAAPSNFKAICTQNLPEPTIVDGGEYFNTVLYTGTGSSLAVTGVGFQPDFVWGKSRSNAFSHVLGDVVRGNSKALFSNLTNAEDDSPGLYVASFDADGFTTNGTGLNTSGATYVAWNWKANGSGVSNTAGTITSTVSANTDSGFSIVTWTASGTSTDTVGHGLGVTPKVVLIKARGATSDWYWMTDVIDGTSDFLKLNTTAAKGDTTFSKTSTTFQSWVGGTGTWVAYCFAAIPNYSAMGSYLGNGSADGPFVYLGFEPSFLLVKNITTAGEDWEMWDSARDPYNVTTKRLKANLSDAEATSTFFDFVSNGIKFRNFSGGFNASGATFIYMAFAENPFKYSLAR